MRIAVSGTHCVGKTTLINDFIQRHSEYECPPEPYYQLLEESDVESGLEPSLEGLLEQLDYSIEQLSNYIANDNVIFDRCPIDFIAYAMCHADKEHFDIEDNEIAERFPEIIELMQQLDLIIFLPITPEHPLIYTEDNPEYRIAADKNFKKIFREDAFNLFPEYNNPRIIEISGDPESRTHKVESYLEKLSHEA